MHSTSRHALAGLDSFSPTMAFRTLTQWLGHSKLIKIEPCLGTTRKELVSSQYKQDFGGSIMAKRSGRLRWVLGNHILRPSSTQPPLTLLSPRKFIQSIHQCLSPYSTQFSPSLPPSYPPSRLLPTLSPLLSPPLQPFTVPVRKANIFAGEFTGQYQQFEGNENNEMKPRKYLNVLRIDAGHSSQSVVSLASQRLTNALAKTIPYRLKTLDLWSELYNYDCSYAEAKLRILQGKGTKEDHAKFQPVLAMAREINLVDALIVTTPMWNYSMPYVLKQYIDIVIQPGVNFRESEGEPPRPIRGGRPLILLTSAGGIENPERDFLAPYLKLIFALVGFEDCRHVHMSGMSKAISKQAKINSKADQIDSIAHFICDFAHHDQV